jgi:hypothetical protein
MICLFYLDKGDKTLGMVFCSYDITILNMKIIKWLCFALVIAGLHGCAVVGGIFKAGFVVGILAVIVVIALIIWLVSAFRSK